MNSSWLSFDQSCSNILVFLFGTFEKLWGAMKNCGKWSEMVAVKFPVTISWELKYYQWESLSEK